MYSAFGHDLCIVFKNCGYEMQFSDKFCEIKKLNMQGTFANNELFWWKYFNSSERVLSKATASHSTIRFRALPWPLNWCLITSMKHET